MEGLVAVLVVVGACSRRESIGCGSRNLFVVVVVVVVVVVGYRLKPFCCFVRTMDAVCNACFVVIVIGLIVDGTEFPPGEFEMDSMSCSIPYNAESAFSKNHPAIRPSDTWWTHAKYKYQLEDQIVVGDTMAVFGLLPGSHKAY
jgi:hypothetical protein